MRKQLAAGMAAFSLTGLVIAAEPPPAAPLEVLDTALVVGEQPGPGLWKVSRDDHVMWVLANYGPLPKGMTWRSQQIEARMWLVSREKYFGRDDDIEEWRPEIALQQLRDKALGKHGLDDGPVVGEVVQLAAKKHKVRIHRLPELERVVRVENPRGMVKNAGKQWSSDFACFSRDLDDLEPGIERLKQRANAWARGDVAKFRELFRVQQPRDDCNYSLMVGMTQGESKGAANTKKLLDDLLWHAQQASVQAQRDWVVAAQVALEKNKSTFAVLQPAAIFAPEGHLETLRKLGYTIEAPL
jgi:hypothetical protein